MPHDLQAPLKFRVDDLLGAEICQMFGPLFAGGAGDDGQVGRQVTSCSDDQGTGILIGTRDDNCTCASEACMGQHFRIGCITLQTWDSQPIQFLHTL